MKTYIDCWISTATTLFSQALAGEPQLTELESIPALDAGQAFAAEISGDIAGKFTVALDPGIVVIGGGLMDHEVTTPEFRERYLRIIGETAAPYLWPAQRATIKIIPAVLGELSQAIGAALVALYQSQG